MLKTVVQLDLVGYSDIARDLEEKFHAGAVLDLDTQIQRLVDEGLRSLSSATREFSRRDVGDSALIFFDDPVEAHQFARHLHRMTQLHNQGITDPSDVRVFRMGAATGEIATEHRSDGTQKLGGHSISIAVRLEQAANPGEFLIDEATFRLLPPPLQQEFGAPELITGKRQEQYIAYRCLCYPNPPYAFKGQLRFVDLPPEHAQAGHPLPRMRVELLPKSGQIPREDYITLRLETGELLGEFCVKTQSGVATFQELIINHPATDTRLVASAPGVESCFSATFNVVKPVYLGFCEILPETWPVRRLLPPVHIRILDAQGQPVSHLPVSMRAENAFLEGTTQVWAKEGIVTFKNLQFPREMESTCLIASVPGGQPVCSNVMSIADRGSRWPRIILGLALGITILGGVIGLNWELGRTFWREIVGRDSVFRLARHSADEVRDLPSETSATERPNGETSQFGALEIIIEDSLAENAHFVLSDENQDQVLATYLTNQFIRLPELAVGTYFAETASQRRPNLKVNRRIKILPNQTTSLPISFKHGQLKLFLNQPARVTVHDAGNPTEKETVPVNRDSINRDTWVGEIRRWESLVTIQIDKAGYLPVHSEVQIIAAKTNLFQVSLSRLEAPLMGRHWTNSIGMVLLWQGTFWAATTETTVRQFTQFADAEPSFAEGTLISVTANGWRDEGATWRNPGFTQTPEHPVVGVNWHEANAFCDWLSKQERAQGQLKSNQKYTLPRDAQWNQLGADESIPYEYPWGASWPPKNHLTGEPSGNYAGPEARRLGWHEHWPTIAPADHQDPFPRTAPVGSFPANAAGFFDLGGNVAEWCQDWYQASMNPDSFHLDNPLLKDEGNGRTYRVLRGGSWYDDQPNDLKTRMRHRALPTERSDRFGFRVILTEIPQPESGQPDAS